MIHFFIILGIFAKSGFSLFNNCHLAPAQCPNENITFWLYTREIKDAPHELTIGDESSFKTAPFVENAKIVILIHGYTGWKDYAPNTEIRPALLRHSDLNVISVDYNSLAKDGCYIQATMNVPIIGECLAQLIDYLVLVEKIPLENFHIIGFSLGCHVAGQLSNFVKSGKLPRITGLDPAKPLFVLSDENEKLDKEDASFVDIIHTNAHPLGKGFMKTMGHVDFYVNGGYQQPPCDKKMNMSADSCSHWKATAYYAESINTKIGFYGKKCNDLPHFLLGICKFDETNEEALMGYHTPITTRGLFFLNTKNTSPYALGKRKTL